MLPNHLDHAILNEYLDAALAPERRAGVEAHLASCLECAARLAEVRSLFAALDALPDAPLPRDLSPAVVAAVSRGRTISSPVAARAFRFAFAAQALAAVILLAFALPIAARAPEWAAVAQFGAQVMETITTTRTAVTAEWAALQTFAQRFVREILDLVNQSSIPAPSWPNLGVCLAAVFVLWLLGNGVFLRRVYSSLPRSQS
jgi:anti-sigma factor RsiW